MIYVLFFFLFSALATVVMLWRASQNAPLRNDWESSADQRWREYRERFAATLDKAPDTVPEDIMELPAMYREPADG